MIKEQKDYVTPKQGLIFTYRGIFDLKKLYSSSKDWFRANHYLLTEKEYKEKAADLGSEFNIILEGERDIDPYSKFVIAPQILILNAKKIKDKYHGKLKMNIAAYVLLDRKNKWQTNPVKAFLFFFYNNFIIKSKIQNIYEDKLYNELLDFITNFKKYVNVK
jgi:hypothetical protein